MNIDQLHQRMGKRESTASRVKKINAGKRIKFIRLIVNNRVIADRPVYLDHMHFYEHGYDCRVELYERVVK